MKKPNVIFIFADQMRQQATGYSGDTNVITPNLDSFARENIEVTHAISGCPVCTPYRACLLTGQYPLTHGLFINGVPLEKHGTTFAEVFKQNGYNTGYVGKWHVDGHGRENFIPRERRKGFDYWKVLEATHHYNRSYYYGDTDEKLTWEGYDAIAQTDDAINYIKSQDGTNPFLLFLSFGPPHAPYNTAPREFKDLYKGKKIKLRKNVPFKRRKTAKKVHKGYYSHISALDDCFGKIIKTVKNCGIKDDTLIIFTSDHGDMLYSQGEENKQKPWDESIRVPFLVSYPTHLHSISEKKKDLLINMSDVMPTVLGLCGLTIPNTVEGYDFSNVLLEKEDNPIKETLISCYYPFAQWNKNKGGKEWRGIRTTQYTYAKTLTGPWLLYDNHTDPYQKHNLIGDKQYLPIQQDLDKRLMKMLASHGDEFLPGEEYLKKWGYVAHNNSLIRTSEQMTLEKKINPNFK